MTKTIFLGLSLLCFGQLKADNIIKLNDENLTEDVTSITFDENVSGNIIIHFADKSSISVNMNLIQVLPSGATAIESTKTGHIARISSVVDGQLTIEGLQGDEVIRVYSVGGKLMHSGKAQAQTTTVSLQGCTAGTYLLCVGDKVIKFNKR